MAQPNRYLNLFSDLAFLRSFGYEPDKDIPIAFLNSILLDDEQIVDMQFVSSKHVTDNPADKSVALDLHCLVNDGRRIIIELQKRPQTHFRERSLYYSTWPIQAQGKRGRWDYNIKAVYAISLLDFVIEPNDPRVVTRKMIMDTETHQPWTNKLIMICVELPKFKKTLEQCTTLQDKWFYVLRNLHNLLEQPQELYEEVFCNLFNIADKSRFEPQALQPFEYSEKEYNSMQNALDYATQDGLAKGLTKGLEQGIAEGLELDKIEVVQGMVANGLDWNLIEKITHLNQADFETLKAKHSA